MDRKACRQYLYFVKSEGTDLTWKKYSEPIFKSFGLNSSTVYELLDTDCEGEMYLTLITIINCSCINKLLFSS